MNKKIIIIAITVLLVFSLSADLFAQSTTTGGRGRRGAPASYNLTVESNVQGAQVFINGEMQKGGTPLTITNLEPGRYDVTVRKSGYYDASRSVTLNGNQTVYINLQGTSYSLTVQTNVSGSKIYLNGERQKGTAPLTITNLSPGTYNLTLQKNGYYDGSRTVNLNDNKTVTINLEARSHTLTVDSNVKGAKVYLNGNLQKGGIPLRMQNLSPGTYDVTVRASGYFDGTATIDLDEDESIQINLQPAVATIIPMKPHPDFRVFVDGRQITEPEQVEPGQHTVTFTIGTLRAEATYTFKAGETYRIEPVLSLNFGGY